MLRRSGRRCAKYAEIRRPVLQDIERNILRVAEHSPQRARTMREAIAHRCFRCCGVCNGNDKAQKLTDELAREFDDAFMPVDPSRLVRHDEHARRNALGFVMAYTDGSASNTGCRAPARAGWGVYYGAGSRHNVASHLSGPVQSLLGPS